MARIIDFFDGAQSSTTPTLGNIVASNLVTYADDATYEATEQGAPAKGNIYKNTTLNLIRYYNGTSWISLVDESSTQTVENKTIDATAATGNNTINMDAVDVSYDNGTSGLTATEVQAAIDELESLLAAIPSGITFKGNWDADTNTPTLSDNGGGGDAGDRYEVSVAGTTTIDGESDWQVGDYITNIAVDGGGQVWQKTDNTDRVTSWNGRTGSVVPETNDYTWAQIDKTTAPIDDLSDVDTTTSAPSIGEVLEWDGSNWVPGTPVGAVSTTNSSAMIENLGFAGSASAGSLDIDVVQGDGSTPSAVAGNEVKVAISDGVSAGTYTIQTITATESITIPSGATLGFQNNDDPRVYIYLCYDSTNLEVGVSKQIFDEKQPTNTTAISAAADSGTVLYTSTTSMTSARIRLIGEYEFNTIATAGTWINPNRRGLATLTDLFHENGIFNTTSVAITNINVGGSTLATRILFNRVGNIVNCSFYIDSVACTVDGTFSVLEIPLPIATNLSSIRHLSGSGAYSNRASEVDIRGNTTSDRAEVRFVGRTAAALISGSFTYYIE